MKFKQSQKFRVIINGVSVYTTAKQIRDQFGDMISINDAVKNALKNLQLFNDVDGSIGVRTRINDVDVQIDML